MQRNKLMGVVALLLCIGMMIPSVSAQALRRSTTKRPALKTVMIMHCGRIMAIQA